ncbi:hypothetical protein I3760_14G012600 [Carya illinoinensis]|nr:hypothetical protein I3760_14G012600 [Carya illinoinensis]
MENLRDMEGRRFDLRRERRTEKIWDPDLKTSVGDLLFVWPKMAIGEISQP